MQIKLCCFLEQSRKKNLSSAVLQLKSIRYQTADPNPLIKFWLRVRLKSKAQETRVVFLDRACKDRDAISETCCTSIYLSLKYREQRCPLTQSDAVPMFVKALTRSRSKWKSLGNAYKFISLSPSLPAFRLVLKTHFSASTCGKQGGDCTIRKP